LRWVALGAGCLLVIHALAFHQRGMLAMLDNEVEVAGGGSDSDPVAETPDSGDDQPTDE